jgi:hypothetical protein
VTGSCRKLMSPSATSTRNRTMEGSACGSTRPRC